VQENEVEREARLREVASKLFFTLKNEGSPFALYRDVDVPEPIRHDGLTLSEVEDVLNTWKLRGPHGGLKPSVRPCRAARACREQRTSVMSKDPPTVEMISDGEALFVVVNGVKVAKRGRPGTPQANTWVLLGPGWTVLDRNYPEEIEIMFEGVRISLIERPRQDE